jgi:sigma-B regulation protein RsbU (phosphoserine phosphatase)
VPFSSVGGETFGCLMLGWDRPGTTPEEDRTFAVKLADVLAVAFMNFRLRIEKGTAERALKLAENEMEAARAIEMKLYPKETPRFEGFDIGGASHPAKTAGGDYYDYIPAPDGSVYIAVGDAVGHGIGAALVMASMRAYLRSLAEMELDMDEMIRRTNRLLSAEVTPDLFCTLALMHLNPETSRLSWINAGHPLPLVLDENGSVRKRLAEGTFPLGIMPEVEPPPVGSVTLKPGELLLSFTDGVPEAQSASKEPYGQERMLQLVAGMMDSSAAGIAEAVYNDVLQYCAPSSPQDDVTCVILKTG